MKKIYRYLSQYTNDWKYIIECPRCNGNKCDNCNNTGHIEIKKTFLINKKEREKLNYGVDAESFIKKEVYSECVWITSYTIIEHNNGVIAKEDINGKWIKLSDIKNANNK